MLCIIRAAALAFVYSLTFAAPAAALDRSAFEQQFGALVEALRASPNAPPGFAVIVTDGQQVVFEGAYGVRNLETGAPMTLDTPIVAASISKSHTALLAARLDAAGVLSLDASLADVWPDLALPEPLDPRAITVRRLLSHQSGMADNWLNLRAITAGNVSLADVAPHISRYATPTPPGFQYSNFGPVLYSMMVEQVTGRDWRDVMADEVFRPMGLTRTTIRLTDLPADDIARCHARLGGAWRTLPMEAAQSLNAAGGIHTSVRDAAHFVQAFATDGASMPAIAREQLARTLMQEVEQSGDLLGLARDGYGLGWDLSAYDGQRIVSRSGGYPGCRSLIAFSPTTGVSISAFAVGDAGANPMLFALAKQAFDIAGDRGDLSAITAARIAEYEEAATAALARADAVAAPDFSRAADPGAMRAYAGRYFADVAGAMDVAVAPHGLTAMWNVFPIQLVPTAEADQFEGYVRGRTEPHDIRFTRDAHGRIAAFEWNGERFSRQR